MVGSIYYITDKTLKIVIWSNNLLAGKYGEKSRDVTWMKLCIIFSYLPTVSE